MVVDIEPKEDFAALPPTERAMTYLLSGDPKGKNFLYCVGNGVVVRDIENPKNYFLYTEHGKTPTAAKYSPSGSYICSGDMSGKIRIWDTTQETHICKCEHQPISGVIKDITWGPENRRIAVSGKGSLCGKVVMWDSGNNLGELRDVVKSGNAIDFKPTRPYRVVVASEDRNTYFYKGPPFQKGETLEGDTTNYSQCVRFSPDGKYFAASKAGGSILLYSGDSGALVGEFGDPKAHALTVCCISFSPDGKELLSASTDKTCKIWDVETRTCKVEFPMGKEIDDQQLSCLWQGNHLLSLSFRGEISYLDRNNPSTPIRVITGHNKSVTCGTVQPNGAIFSASFDGALVKWNSTTGEGVRFKGKGHGTKVSGLLYNPEDNLLVSVGIDNNVRIMDADSCDFTACKSIPLDSEPTASAISSDGTIVIVCEKELVLIRNGAKVASVCHAGCHPNKVAVAGSKIYVTGPETKEGFEVTQGLQAYEIEGDTLKKVELKHSKLISIGAIATSSDGSQVAVAERKYVRVFQVADGFEKPQEFQCHSQSVKCLAWSPNGQLLASGSVDCGVAIYNIATGEYKLFSGAHPKKPVVSVAWLDDNTLVSFGEDSAIKQWTVKI